MKENWQQENLEKTKKVLKEHFKRKKVVWKYDVPVYDYFTLEIPSGSEILHFGLQHGQARLWILVDPSKERVEKRFRLARTGHNITEDYLKYIGTIEMSEGRLILHLFEC